MITMLSEISAEGAAEMLKAEGFVVAPSDVRMFQDLGVVSLEQARAAAMLFGEGRTARGVHDLMFGPIEAAARDEGEREWYDRWKVSVNPDDSRTSCKCLGERCECETTGPPRRPGEDDEGYARRVADLKARAAGKHMFSEGGNGVAIQQFSERGPVLSFMREIDGRVAEGRRSGVVVSFSEAAAAIAKEKPELYNEYTRSRDHAARTEGR